MSWAPLVYAQHVIINPYLTFAFHDPTKNECDFMIGTVPMDQNRFPDNGIPYWFLDRPYTPREQEFRGEAEAYVARQIVGAMAAMSCRNITSKLYEPTPAECKNQRKAGNLEPVSYHTLRVEIPRTASGGQGVPDLENPADPRRLHVVRGHFKNLTADRFKEKGWHWWPAHLRGSAEVGSVVKDYLLTEEKVPAQL